MSEPYLSAVIVWGSLVGGTFAIHYLGLAIDRCIRNAADRLTNTKRGVRND